MDAPFTLSGTLPGHFQRARSRRSGVTDHREAQFFLGCTRVVLARCWVHPPIRSTIFIEFRIFAHITCNNVLSALV